MTDLEKERIAVLRSRGESYARIAETLGISENTIKSYCRRNGIGIAIKAEQPATTGVCANCGGLLSHTEGAKPKRFCSDNCRMAWWKAHPEAVNRKAVYDFTCPVCGRAFSAYGNAHRKYCSRACSVAARRTLS
jgi:endogenous inhibitor of DNA gyrase (YacG/DUF329 family)